LAVIGLAATTQARLKRRLNMDFQELSE